MVAESESLPEHLKERKPELSDFKREMDYFVDLYGKCDALENEVVFLRWLRLDIRAFKQALLNTVCKWTNTFKTYLIDRINNEYVFTHTRTHTRMASSVFLFPSRLFAILIDVSTGDTRRRMSRRLGNLSEFLTKALRKFMQPIAADDYEDLLDTMYYLKEVRDRQYQIDDMWEPIKVIVNVRFVSFNLIPLRVSSS